MSVLNDAPPSPARAQSEPSKRTPDEKLKLVALRVKSQFGAKGLVDYSALSRSSEYADLKAAAYELRTFDLSLLTSAKQKTAFWINVYNSLVVHAIVERQARENLRSVRDVSSFFERTAYIVGGHSLSLTDIENGILRANRRPPYRFSTPFGSSDPRLALALKQEEFDSRVHFALNCGSRSCPPFAFFDAGRLDAQLESAAQGFINGDSEVRDGAIWISKIFDWYAPDFAPNARAYVLARAEGELKTALEDPKMPLRFSEYDWGLNQAEGGSSGPR